LKNKSIKIDFDILLQIVPIIKARYYSISSSSNYTNPKLSISKNKLTITVGRVHYQTTRGIKNGLCSNFLATLNSVQSIHFIVSPCKSAFHLTNKHDCPIIMICAGTGIAPFRGFIHERAFAKERGNKLGETVLFYGVQNKLVCAYMDELLYMQNQGVLTKLFMAYSRENGQPKKYVQNVISENGEYIWDLVSNKQATIYVCGNATTLGKGIREAFLSLAQNIGKLTADNAQQFLNQCLESSQYVEDVWGTQSKLQSNS